MTKIRKIRVGSFVKYAGKEWVVIKKSKTNCRLLRRQVKTGQPICVPKKRLKHADQTWRKLLMPGDPLELFIGGQWTPAAVFRREETHLLVQPSFNNFTMRVSEDAGIIARASHSFPLWERDEISSVIHAGECRIERGQNLLFPWSYTNPDTRRAISGPISNFVTRMEIPYYKPDGFQLDMYKDLTKYEIMCDIWQHPSKHPIILQLIAKQFCCCRLPTYTYLQNAGIQFYITEALAHDDNRRVQELLSVGENNNLFHKNEWLVREHLSHPYIDCNLKLREKKLQVEIIYSGMKVDKICDCVSRILEHFSEPMAYVPKKITVDSSPEMQYILSRMLGMEQEPVELLTTRKIKNHMLTLERGFCQPQMKICGGQLNVDGISYPLLVKELMRRSPMKTLVVVEKNALPIWKDFNVYYGRNRSVEQLTVTTKTLFSRLKTTAFASIERLFVVVDTSWYSSFGFDAKHFKCNVKWAVGCGRRTNSSIFQSKEKNDKLCISLSKEEMITMGVDFPTVTHQPVIFDVDKESMDKFIQRLKASHASVNPLMTGWRRSHCSNMLSLYLEHPELVPLDYRGEKLDAVEATIGSISNQFGVSEKKLNNRAHETCSVCLETITDASVTPCGHVFCCECMQELHKRQINCPMCRSKITSFLKLSDKNTSGRVDVLRGVPYRIPENEKWGKKMEFLKKHKDATIITGCDTSARQLKRKLQKIFRKRQILTIEEMNEQQHPVSSKVIMLKPSHSVQQSLGLAWGKDIEVLELQYRTEDTPFGKKYY